MTRRSLVLWILLSPLLVCGTDEAVKFGAVLPMTGEAAIYGLP